MAKSKHAVTYAGPTGSWEKGKNRKHPKPINERLQTLIDAATFYQVAHVLLPLAPVLGIPPTVIDQREMCYDRDAMEILVTGAKLERLTLQLEILRGERDAFLTLREVTA